MIEIKTPTIGSEELQKVLNTDPLSVAEELTGKSYKTDKDTENLGLGLHLLHNESKTRLLEQLGDSTFSMKIDKYLLLVESLGFVKIFEQDFHANGYRPQDSGYDEKYYVYFHPKKGCLLHVESHAETSLNSAKVYFETKLRENGVRFQIPYSGQFESPIYPRRDWPEDELPEDLVLVGSFDVREALIHKMSVLDGAGEYQKKWLRPYRPKFMWLVNYVETREVNHSKGTFYKDVTLQKMEAFPKYVKDAIQIEQFRQ